MAVEIDGIDEIGDLNDEIESHTDCHYKDTKHDDSRYCSTEMLDQEDKGIRPNHRASAE